MKTNLLVCAFLLGFLPGFGQTNHIAVTTWIKNIGIPRETPHKAALKPASAAKSAKTLKYDPAETRIGNTYYDRQSNNYAPTRLYRYSDGSIGATWMYGFQNSTNFPDRGTGYNYFDGAAWGPEPTARIENVRCGWPSYAPYGPEGELVVTHKGDQLPLLLAKRGTRGGGAWSFSDIPKPSGAAGLLWPQAVTSGENHQVVHVLALTSPVSNGGILYKGMDGALVYSRSSDGGNTWDRLNVQLPGTDSSCYLSNDGDTYSWAEPRGNTVAFVAGGQRTDLYLMKSDDGGDTWTKTLIWQNPYPKFVTTMLTDTFYCPDGCISCVIDRNNTVHVAFGLNRSRCDGTTTYWFPGVGGVAYWNENLSVWTGHDQWHCLDPDSVDAMGRLIGFPVDVNGNGTWDILAGSVLDVFGKYYVGCASMANLILDDQDRLYLIYAAITEGFDNTSQNYRHLWAVGSANMGSTWGEQKDLTNSLFHNFTECVYPSAASNSADGYVHLIYQEDDEPGMAVAGDEDPYGENRIVYMKVSKSEILYLEPPADLQATLTGNNVHLSWTSPVTSLLGYNVYRNGTMINPDTLTVTFFDDNNLPNGSYNYQVSTVYTGGESDLTSPVTVNISLGTHDVDAPALRIYPNPASGQVTVSSDLPVASIQVTDLAGKTCLEENRGGCVHVLSTGGLKPGIYLLRARFATGSFSYRLEVK